MAVQVSRSRHGYLALRIFWRGRDEWVGTKLRDDGEAGKNRRRLEAKAVLVLGAARSRRRAPCGVAGRSRRLPASSVAHKPPSEAKPITIGEFAEWWLTHIAERERRNYWRKATSYVQMEQVLPGQDPDDPFADPITESNDLQDAGDRMEAHKILMELCQSDLRCLDAHAHLGNFVFDRSPQ
ncbi:MAG: hypothetical protein ACRD2A_26735, partial [Vicinamibacterales bacterium]